MHIFFFSAKIPLGILNQSCLCHKNKSFNLRQGLSFNDTKMLHKFKQNAENTQIVENFLVISLFNWFEAEIMYKKTLACMEYICEDSAYLSVLLQ